MDTDLLVNEVIDKNRKLNYEWHFRSYLNSFKNLDQDSYQFGSLKGNVNLLNIYLN